MTSAQCTAVGTGRFHPPLTPLIPQLRRRPSRAQVFGFLSPYRIPRQAAEGIWASSRICNDAARGFARRQAPCGTTLAVVTSERVREHGMVEVKGGLPHGPRVAFPDHGAGARGAACQRRRLGGKCLDLETGSAVPATLYCQGQR